MKDDGNGGISYERNGGVVYSLQGDQEGEWGEEEKEEETSWMPKLTPIQVVWRVKGKKRRKGIRGCQEQNRAE